MWDTTDADFFLHFSSLAALVESCGELWRAVESRTDRLGLSLRSSPLLSLRRSRVQTRVCCAITNTGLSNIAVHVCLHVCFGAGVDHLHSLPQDRTRCSGAHLT